LSGRGQIPHRERQGHFLGDRARPQRPRHRRRGTRDREQRHRALPVRRHRDRRGGRALSHQHRQELAHRPRHRVHADHADFRRGRQGVGLSRDRPDGGQAEIPLRLGRNYTLLLYRHGYQQVTGKVSVDKSGEAREFVLAANNALFKVDSEPSAASVYIDDEPVGKTPLAGGKTVTLGFHSVRLAYGEDYRDCFEVMEFTKKEEDRTGERRIVLQKDFLKLGERARQKGDIDGAIKAYAAAGRGHPDYAEARRRLGDIYLDDKEDYDAAIAEFETVLALPENQQLIYKQFAVTFTNLGHAYCEKGNRLVTSDRDAASSQFAKAIKALQTARQNTRFFPSAEYDEAVHDTYYYTALSYHKLYLLTKQPAVMNSASLAWREYFDFFPKKLEGIPTFVQAREAARRYRDQIQEQ